MDYSRQYAAYQEAIESYLNKLFITDQPYGKLQESMRYSVLAGGKRIRPVLTLEFCRICGLNRKKYDQNKVDDYDFLKKRFYYLTF